MARQNRLIAGVIGVQLLAAGCRHHPRSLRTMIRRRGVAGPTIACAWLLVAMTASGCSSSTAEVSAQELRDAVQRDGIVLEATAIPPPLIDRLADNRVVLLGETHHLREHWVLVAELMTELRDAGFAQLLIEAPHMSGWLFDDYVQGSPLRPEWDPPPFWQRRLRAIRTLNETLPTEQRVHVYGIDANEEWYGGAADFHLLLGWLAEPLPTPGPLRQLLDQDYSGLDAATQSETISTTLRALEDDRSALIDRWGTEFHGRVVEMLETELASITVRARRRDDDNDGARAREEVIKQLVDQRIVDCDCRTLINIGAHHAQKTHLMGTIQEWLGDYLTHSSRAAAGSIIVVAVSSAATELESGAEGTPWDILDSNSPPNELRRVIAETYPGLTVFMPFDDPLFAERTVAFNSEDRIYAAHLERHFDAVIQYGHATRMPIG